MNKEKVKKEYCPSCGDEQMLKKLKDSFPDGWICLKCGASLYEIP